MKSTIFDKSYQEHEVRERFHLQSKKMLRVYLSGQETIVAAAGSMVAYQGNVSFSYKGAGGLGKFIKKQLSGEDAPLMKVQGQGDVFFARQAEEIFLLQLEGDGLSVSSHSLLAFDDALDYDIKMLRSGGALMAGGLFNVQLQGHGLVAVTSDGPPLLLDCSQQPTFVDPQAALCWSANLQPSFKNDTNIGSLIGRGSGESIQMMFHGPGFVVVQPSEGTPVIPQASSGGSGASINLGDLFG